MDIEQAIAQVRELIDGLSLTPGQSVMVGKELVGYAGELDAQAKETARPNLDEGRWIDAGIAFDLVSATETTSVDTAAVRKIFPPDDCPDIYKVAARSEYVRASIYKGG